jgi:hypothetical protein
MIKKEINKLTSSHDEIKPKMLVLKICWKVDNEMLSRSCWVLRISWGKRGGRVLFIGEKKGMVGGWGMAGKGLLMARYASVCKAFYFVMGYVFSAGTDRPVFMGFPWCTVVPKFVWLFGAFWGGYGGFGPILVGALGGNSRHHNLISVPTIQIFVGIDRCRVWQVIATESNPEFQGT